MIKLLTCFFFSVLLSMSAAASAASGVSSFNIATKTARSFLKYNRPPYITIPVTGVCFWLHEKPIPHMSSTLELSQYLPDLVVTVYPAVGDDPWIEAKTIYDIAANEAAQGVSSLFGFPFTAGSRTNEQNMTHADTLQTRIVHVVGNPFLLTDLPKPRLRYATSAFTLYYHSELDAFADRTGIAEMVHLNSYGLFFNMIGNWENEFPRYMEVNNVNNYKVSVITALRAADIVTNDSLGQTLHVVLPVSDACGENCAISNVTEDNKGIIWQEVYPINHTILPGQTDNPTNPISIGISDDNAGIGHAGKGRYVFVLWRHYHGCVQNSGKFITATEIIPDTKRRV